MTILGSGGPNAGFVGIGPGFLPNFRLDVDKGDINVNQPTNGYRIGGTSAFYPSKYVLWHNGNTDNIYVGVDAGNGNVTNIGDWNSFMGNYAGTNIGKGNENTFIGAYAGYSNIDNGSNSFLGYLSGYNNTGDWNTFIGRSAGENSFIDNNNTVTGAAAGYSMGLAIGDYNCYYGVSSGGATGSPSFGNSCFGANSNLLENGGSYNTYIGYNAQYSATYNGFTNYRFLAQMQLLQVTTN